MQFATRLIPHTDFRSRAFLPPKCSPASPENCLREKHVLSDWGASIAQKMQFALQLFV